MCVGKHVHQRKSIYSRVKSIKDLGYDVSEHGVFQPTYIAMESDFGTPRILIPQFQRFHPQFCQQILSDKFHPIDEIIT